MTLDILILNSGEWLLSEELPAEPWHILIYRNRSEKRNELHIWLPRQGERGSDDYAFRRYWVEGRVRWCVEAPSAAADSGGRKSRPASQLRFTAPDGQVLWAETQSPRKLADFTDRELQRIRQRATSGAFSGR